MADFVQFGTVSSFALPALPGGDSGVLRFGAFAPDQTVRFDPQPGVSSTVETGNWTLALDLLVPAPASAGVFTALIQTNLANANDGDLFIRSASTVAGGVGISGTYSGTFDYGEWQRVVVTAERAPGSTTITLRKYIDGVDSGTQVLNDPGGRFNVFSDDGFLLFSDEDGETTSGFVSSVAVVDRPLTTAEVEALGAADADGIFSAAPANSTATQFDFTNASYAATFGIGTLTAPGDTDPPSVPSLAVANRVKDILTTVGDIRTIDIAGVFNRTDVTITLTNGNGTVVAADLDGTNLTLDFTALGHSDILLTATAADGSTATDAFRVRAAGEGAYTIVVMPDTQDYTDASLTNGPPSTFYGMTQWIVDNVDDRAMQFVITVGDITQNNLASEWPIAVQALRTMDGVVPYSLAPGNHDQAAGGTAANHSTDFLDTLFSPAAQAATSPDTFGGTYDREPDRSANTFHTFTAPDGTKWLVLSIEFGPRDDVIRWAGDVIEQHLDHRVIVSSHHIGNWGAGRSDPAGIPLHDEGGGNDYGMRTDPQGANYAEDMYRELWARYPNVTFTFSGHVFGDGGGTIVSTSQHGNPVHEMVVNYQNGVAREITGNGDPALGGLGGNGALRILTIDPANETVWTETYFTRLDDYLDGVRVQAELDRDGLTGPYANTGHQEVLTGLDLGTPEARATADAGADQFIVIGGLAGIVTLDGTGTSDPTALAQDFAWLKDGAVIATGKTADVSLAVGRHLITLNVTDTEGRVTRDDVFVNVAGDGTLLVDNFNDGDADGWAYVPPPVDNPLKFGSVASFGLTALPGGTDDIVRVPAFGPTQSLLLEPNLGAPAGFLVGDYTVAFDIYVPAGQGTWTALLQTNVANTDDAELFIRRNADGTGGIGISGNYSGAFQYDAWQRIVFTFDDLGNGTSTLNKYIEGSLVGTQTVSGDRFKLDVGRGALLFSDDSNETSALFASSVLFTGAVLSTAEVAALGGATAGGIIQPAPVPPSAQFDFTGGSLLATGGIAELTFGGGGSNPFLIKGSVFAPGATTGEGRLFDQSDRADNVFVWNDSAALEWTDYVLETQQRSTDNDGIGAVFRFVDAANHYRVVLNGETNLRQLVKLEDGVETVLASESGGTRFNVDQQLKIVAAGGTFTVFLDGKLLFGGAVTDEDPITAGSVGLFSDEQRVSIFDNVTVNAVRLTAAAGLDRRVADLDDDGAAEVALSGLGSYGLSDIVSFSWTDAEGQLRATGATPTIALPVGTHALTLTVRDAQGTTASDSVVVTVLGAESILASADFSTSDLSAWTIVDEGEFGGVGPDGLASDWKVEGGTLVQASGLASRQLEWDGASNPDVYLNGWSPHGDGVNMLRRGTQAIWNDPDAADWTDYAIEATISTPDNGALGFLFRYQDANNYYKLEVNADGIYDRDPGNGAGSLFTMTRVADGIEQVLGQVPGKYAVNESFKLRLEADGIEFRAYLDDEQLFQSRITDTALSAGTIALYAWDSAGVSFDDVRVELLEPETPEAALPLLRYSDGGAGSPPGTGQAGPETPQPRVDRLVATQGDFELDGRTYTLVEQTGVWNAIKNAALLAEDYLPKFGTAFAFVNFVDMRADLSDALKGVDVLVVGAKRGAVVGSDFDDRVEWIAHSNGGDWSEVARIGTGDGDDEIIVRAVASSTLDDQLLADNDQPRNGALWDRQYDGRKSTVFVESGDGDDRIELYDRITAQIDAGAGDDIVFAGRGAVVADGGTGFNVFALAGQQADYDIEEIGSLVVVTGDEGVAHVLTNFQQLRFANVTVDL